MVHLAFAKHFLPALSRVGCGCSQAMMGSLGTLPSKWSGLEPPIFALAHHPAIERGGEPSRTRWRPSRQLPPARAGGLPFAGPRMWQATPPFRRGLRWIASPLSAVPRARFIRALPSWADCGSGGMAMCNYQRSPRLLRPLPCPAHLPPLWRPSWESASLVEVTQPTDTEQARKSLLGLKFLNGKNDWE